MRHAPRLLCLGAPLCAALAHLACSSNPSTSFNPEGDQDAHSVCLSIDQACADGGGSDYRCIRSWSLAAQPVTWCSGFQHQVGIGSRCDGVNVVLLGSGDASTSYFYDPASGALVGISRAGIVEPVFMDLGAGENGCIAGEQPSVSLRDCTDGGFMNFTCESDGAVSD